MIPEFHRPVPLDRIGPHGLDLTVEATHAECSALAVRMQLPAVLSLSCEFHLIREGRDIVLARGVLRSLVTQTCVITLEEFDAPVEEVFQVRFVPSGEENDDLDPETDDEIPFEGNRIDLGEAAAEQLGLALEPYPRMPGSGTTGATTDDIGTTGVARSDIGITGVGITGAEVADADPAPHPFSALRRLN